MSECLMPRASLNFAFHVGFTQTADRWHARFWLHSWHVHSISFLLNHALIKACLRTACVGHAHVNFQYRVNRLPSSCTMCLLVVFVRWLVSEQMGFAVLFSLWVLTAYSFYVSTLCREEKCVCTCACAWMTETEVRNSLKVPFAQDIKKINLKTPPPLSHHHTLSCSLTPSHRQAKTRLLLCG